MRFAAKLFLVFAAPAWCQCLYLPYGRSALGFSYSMGSICDVASMGGSASFGIKGVVDIGFSYASLENEDPDTWEEYPDNYKGLTFGFHPIKQSEKIPVGLSAGVSWGVVGYPEDAFETNYYARSIGAMISRNWPVADRFAFLTTGGILNSGKVKHGEVFLPLSVEGIVNPSGQFKLVLDLTMLPIAPCDRMGYSMGLSLIGMTAPRKTGPKTL